MNLKRSAGFIVLWVLFLCRASLASEVWIHAQKGDPMNPGTQEAPLHSIQDGIAALGSEGGIIHASGTYFEPWKFKDLRYSAQNPLLVKGEDGCLIWGFALPPPYNPATHYERTMYACLTLQDSEHITIENVECQGGGSEGIGLNDSYPWVDMEGNPRGLGWITLDRVTVRNCKANGIFSGGYVIHDLTIRDCKVIDTIVPPGHGDTNHGIYISGGNWKPEWPPYWNIRIIGTEVTRTGGRHCIQFNCRATNVEIRNCLLRHAELCGLSSIGVQGLVFENNIVYGCNRQCIVIYDYDWYVDWSDPAAVEKFLATHRPNRDHIIKNNTLIVGPKQWKVDAWHNNNPNSQPVILINNDVHHKAILHGYEYPTENIVIMKNIMVSQCAKVINTYHAYETEELILLDNLVWIPEGLAPGYVGDGKPKFIKGNLLADPKFKQGPEYPDLIDMTKEPFYWWSRQHKTEFNAFSRLGKKLGVGQKFPVVPLMREDGVEIDALLDPRKAKRLDLESAEDMRKFLKELGGKKDER